MASRSKASRLPSAAALAERSAPVEDVAFQMDSLMTFASEIRSIATVSLGDTHHHVEAGLLKHACHVASDGRIMKTSRSDDARDGRTSNYHETWKTAHPRSRRFELLRMPRSGRCGYGCCEHVTFQCCVDWSGTHEAGMMPSRWCLRGLGVSCDGECTYPAASSLWLTAGRRATPETPGVLRDIGNC